MGNTECDEEQEKVKQVMTEANKLVISIEIKAMGNTVGQEKRIVKSFMKQIIRKQLLSTYNIGVNAVNCKKMRN